jgi:hypothetical protein
MQDRLLLLPALARVVLRCLSCRQYHGWVLLLLVGGRLLQQNHTEAAV